MRRRKFFIPVVLLFTATQALSATSESTAYAPPERGIHPQLMGSWMNQGESSGFDAGAALLTEIQDGRWMLIGPRVRSYRFERFFAGLESTAWLANALGPGLAIDHEFASREKNSLQLQPFFSARFERVGEMGALAGRLGPIYDTRQKWGIRLELTLQLTGVEN